MLKTQTRIFVPKLKEGPLARVELNVDCYKMLLVRLGTVTLKFIESIECQTISNLIYTSIDTYHMSCRIQCLWSCT